jgi:hypothetical protein
MAGLVHLRVNYFSAPASNFVHIMFLTSVNS